jgi:hypothetical protein
MTPTVANGQPAAATYHRDGDGTYHALGTAILTRVCPALTAGTGRIEAHQRQVQAYHRCPLGRRTDSLEQPHHVITRIPNSH